MVQAAKANNRLSTRFTKQLMNLARSKLTGFSDVNQNLEQYTSDAKLAVIDVRVQLDYEPKREGTTATVSRLVASHMRTAFSLPRHRKYMRSGYPSEAWLAEEAEQELEVLPERRPPIVYTILNELMTL